MLDQIDASADGSSLSIDGDAGERATYNNEGTGKMPRRELFNASDDDIEAMQELIADRILDRLEPRGVNRYADVLQCVARAVGGNAIRAFAAS